MKVKKEIIKIMMMMMMIISKKKQFTNGLLFAI